MIVNKTSQALALSIALALSPAITLSDEFRSPVVTADEVKWGYLNPLRGENSPGAADLWGDRSIDTATGMLVRFKKGFASPPHIHNISYRGIVIEGMMHNDDPGAEKMWMPAGSFWAQPAGEDHVTAASGEDNLIYLEIDSGPYLVQPSDQHFDNGERPVNLHESNLVWLDHGDLKPTHGQPAGITQLWGSHQPGALSGTMVRLAPGYRGSIGTDASEFRGVVVQGDVAYRSTDLKETKTLKAGSYFASAGTFNHEVSTTDGGALIYIRTDGNYELTTRQ